MKLVPGAGLRGLLLHLLELLLLTIHEEALVVEAPLLLAHALVDARRGRVLRGLLHMRDLEEIGDKHGVL